MQRNKYFFTAFHMLCQQSCKNYSFTHVFPLLSTNEFHHWNLTMPQQLRVSDRLLIKAVIVSVYITGNLGIVSVWDSFDNFPYRFAGWDISYKKVQNKFFLCKFKYTNQLKTIFSFIKQCQILKNIGISIKSRELFLVCIWENSTGNWWKLYLQYLPCEIYFFLAAVTPFNILGFFVF
jgi:hypothetical protein